MALFHCCLAAVVIMTHVRLADQSETVSPKVLYHLSSRSIFQKLSKGLNKGTASPVAGTDTSGTTNCPYDDVITCDSTYKYRSFDGSCNNLANPFWGRADTPFERLLVPKYEDGTGSMRVTPHRSSGNLIGPRRLSTEYHEASSSANLQTGVNLITMEFGQFISHDVNRNTVSRAANGRPLQCCTDDMTVNNDASLIQQGCAAIPVPAGDPFFGPFNKRCINFARAVSSTDIYCDNTYRQQKNRVTHFLDASLVYGSDKTTADEIRTFTDGLLKTVGAPQDGRELMPQSPTQGNFGCRAAQGSTDFCFIAGDTRVNQNPMLISLHTMFLREHNRVARELKPLNPNWDDEKLYQETRRIVIAQYQHIVYAEYLPALLTVDVTAYAGLLPKQYGYYSGYDRSVNAAVRNEFMAAGYRSGHSTIASTISSGELLKNHFFNPAIIYEAAKGVDFMLNSLVQNQQQKMDRLKTDQVTNHLFQFADGSGGDLAATNIQRGRDHGLPSYNDMRELCGFRRAKSFSATKWGLEHHTAEAASKLSSVYDHPDDIEAWTGMSSEKRLAGGVFGPTAACITAIQFSYFKQGDRFYYENDLIGTKFSENQLKEIRKASLARLLCDNTGISSIQKYAFWDTYSRNPEVNCAKIARVDLRQWSQDSCDGDGWATWGEWSRCSKGRRLRSRRCLKENCPRACRGHKVQRDYCSNQWSPERV